MQVLSQHTSIGRCRCLSNVGLDSGGEWSGWRALNFWSPDFADLSTIQRTRRGGCVECQIPVPAYSTSLSVSQVSQSCRGTLYTGDRFTGAVFSRSGCVTSCATMIFIKEWDSWNNFQLDIVGKFTRRTRRRFLQKANHELCRFPCYPR